jgi:uncharacterized protein (TIGR03435 family)
MSAGIKTLFGVVLIAIVSTAATAQEAPHFTVISVRPSIDNAPGSQVAPRANGDYSVRKVTLSGLLAGAYGIPTSRMEGAPPWWKTDRFDIDARYEHTDTAAPVPPLPLLMQSLLRDRFGLVAHTEKRMVPIYALRIAARDRHLGAGLQPSLARCAALGQPVNAAERETRAPNGAPLCGANENPEAFIASGMSIDVLAQALRPATGRDVVNQTGLDGKWDITLQFAPLGATSSDKPGVSRPSPN